MYMLKPISNVSKKINTSNEWIAENNDPQLLIVGWEDFIGKNVKLSFKLEKSQFEPSICVIYSDTGLGFSENTAISLNVDEHGYVSEVICFPRTLCGLRFDPISIKSAFKIVDLKIEIICDSDMKVKNAVREIKNTNIDYSESRGYFRSEKKGYTYISKQMKTSDEVLIRKLEENVGLISIIIPTYNTDKILLEKLVDSLFSQWYGKWEAIFVDDCSTVDTPELFICSHVDSRIKFYKLNDNLGIAGATNIAIDNCSGEYVVFLDHDDELTSDCLFEIANAINISSPDFIYSDEDKINEKGQFTQPHFKPAWSPDTLMSTMYTCHVMCIRKDVLLKVGGLRSKYDGCQDWDLVLRVSEITDKFVHIPKVLYHWRIIPQSIASDLNAKPNAIANAKMAREEALIRRGLKGELEEVPYMPGFHRVNYHLVGDPLISIIIPTRDNFKTLKACIDSIKNISTYKNYEIIIVDNGSVDINTINYLSELSLNSRVSVIKHDFPFNFSEVCNKGVSVSNGEYLLFLNDDTEVITDDWMQRLAGYAQLPHVGAVGAKLLYPGEEFVQHSGVINLHAGPGHSHLKCNRYDPGYFGRNLLEYNHLAVTGACLMVNRNKFFEVEGFNETLPIAYNDVEICMHLHDAGYYNLICQAVELIHHESISRGIDEICPEKIERLKTDYRKLFKLRPTYYQYDPFYNINLHPNNVYFEVL